MLNSAASEISAPAATATSTGGGSATSATPTGAANKIALGGSMVGAAAILAVALAL